MQTIRWYRLFALGALAVPFVVHAQTRGPQPIIKEIATIPGVYVDFAARMPNGRVIIYGSGDSIAAYDLTTKRTTVIAHGYDYDMEISRQGDRIAYARSSEGGKTDFIWSLPVDPRTGAATGIAQRVTMRPGDTPRFSPDGKTIAFAALADSGAKGGSLALVPATGGPERILAKYGRWTGPDTWSADGKWIYVGTGFAYDSSKSIQRVPAAGGRSETMISYDAAGNSQGSIGGTIAFYLADRTAPAPGRMAYVTASGARGEFRIPPASYLSFESAQTILPHMTSPSVLHVFSASDGTIHDLWTNASRTRYPSWSRDGKRVAFATGDGDQWDLVLMNVDGSGQHRIPLTGGPASGNGASFWSPDGANLVYYSGGGRELRVYTLATGSSRTLTNFPAPNIMYWPGLWRADGKSFLAHTHLESSSGARTNYAIVEIRLDGTQRVVRNLSAEFPGTWGAAPLSEKTAVVIVGDSSQQQLYLVPLDGGPAKQIPAPAIPNAMHNDMHVVWSAVSEAWLVRMHYQGNVVTGIDVISTTGTPNRVLHLPPGTLVRGPAAISPDEQHLVLLERLLKQADFTAFSIPLDGGPQRTLGSLPHAVLGGYYGFPAAGWTQDGNYFAFPSDGPPTAHIISIDVTPILKSLRIH